MLLVCQGMTTTIDRTSRASPSLRAPGREALVVLAGALAGTALGILARVWMRIISTDPGFTVEGTTFIVLGFTVFGLAQSLTALARRRSWRPAATRAMRVVGCIGMMPLFLAAGGVMAPTVVAGGLALWRTDWPRWGRLLLFFLAMAPVMFVSRQIIGDFGWDIRTVVGIAGLLGVYACIVRANRATLLRPLHPWRLRWVAAIVGAAAALLAIAQVGIR